MLEIFGGFRAEPGRIIAPRDALEAAGLSEQDSPVEFS
jgi:hypothetical protein